MRQESFVLKNSTYVLGVRVDSLSMKQTVDRCCELIETRDAPAYQVSINAAKVVSARASSVLMASLQGASLANADGQSVVWASQLLGRQLPERVAGIDLMHRLLGESERRGYRPYILGAAESVLNRAIARILENYPELELAGWHHGYYRAEREPSIIAAIKSAAPDVLFIALPSPRKELFIDRYLNELDVPFAMGVGGSVDVIAGEVRRAPKMVQTLGLEWLYRLLQEPKKLTRRYVVTNAKFVGALALETAKQRWPLWRL